MSNVFSILLPARLSATPTVATIQRDHLEEVMGAKRERRRKAEIPKSNRETEIVQEKKKIPIPFLL